MKTRGEIPRAIRACVAACTKSKANCAASATSRIQRGRFVGGAHARGGEHEHRAERVRRLAEPAEHPLQPDLPLGELENVAEHHARGDAERHELERQQEQHRHEDELRCDGQSRADLEVDVVGEGVGTDEREHQQRRGVGAES